MDVEINLNGKLVDTTIYTGGDLGILKGDVKVNLSSKANVTEFDKTNHIGNLDVTLKKDFFSALLNLNGINNLYMEENARVSLPKNSEFNVDNVTLLNNAVIDFRNLTMNPLINGNFIGAIKSSDDIKGSAILLNNKQTLNIIGTVSGTTRLNNCGVEYVAPLEEGHDYVKAYSKSTGEFTLIDRNTNYRIEEAEVGNTKSWSAIKEGQELTNIDWYENTSEVIENPVLAPGEFYNEYFYKIKYQDEEGKNMDVMDAIDHLKVEVIDEDGNVTGEFDDFDLFTTALGVRFHVELENDEYSELILEIYKPEKVHGKLTLRVTDMKNNKIIEKPIYVVKDGDDIEGDVSLPQGAIVGSIISADISNLTEGCEELTYTWYADGNEVLKETNNEFKVTEEYLNQNITVKVSAKNKLNEIGSLSGTTVKSEEFAPVIKGVDDITISASDIDRFNETGKLDKVTDTYENVDLKSEITVTGEARRPALGTSEVFELVYEVKNSLGISTKVVRQVTVSNHAPVISGLTDLIILEGEEVDLTKDVIAEDKEDGEIISITYPSEKSSELPVGLNTLEYSVQDKDGNITKMTRRVIVIGKHQI